MLDKLKYMKEVLAANPYFREYSPAKQLEIELRFLVSRIFRGTALIDYAQYSYFNLSRDGQKRFIDIRKRRRMIKKMNNPQKFDLFDSKALFNQEYSKYIHRSWLNLETASFDEFKEFMETAERVFIKPTCGTYGIGISSLDRSEATDLAELFREYSGKPYVFEEEVKAYADLEKFNPTSLNTLRVVTVTVAGKANIFGAVFRMGRSGSIVDNNHSGGLSALVDVDTGVIYTTATDQKYGRYVLHPDSGVQIVGAKIPCWEEIKEKVCEIALLNPDVAYVGWDIALDSEGRLELIEGNYSADPDVLQKADQVGKWNKLKQYEQR